MTENSLALARREANCIDCDLQDAARAKGRERISDLRNAEQRIQMLAYHIGKALDSERVAALQASGWNAFREAALGNAASPGSACEAAPDASDKGFRDEPNLPPCLGVAET